MEKRWSIFRSSRDRLNNRILQPSGRQTSNGGHSLLIGLAICLLIAIIIFEIGIQPISLLLIAESLLLIVPLWYRVLQASFDPFEPLVAATVALSAMFIARPLADILLGNYTHDGYDVRSTFEYTLLVIFSGTVALEAGYACSLGKIVARRARPAPENFSTRTASKWACALTFIALVGTATFLATSGGFGTLLLLLKGRATNNDAFFRGSTGYIYMAPNALIPAALIFFICGAKTRKKSFYLASLLASLPLAALTLSRGDRSQLLPLIMALVVLWYARRGLRPRLITFIVTVFLFVIASSVIREYRDFEKGNKMTVSDVLLNPSDAFLSLIAKDDDEMFDTLANAISIVPTAVPFDYGCSVTDIFLRAVPRLLVPDKSLECPDAVVAYLWPKHYAATRAVQATSLIGNFYVDSGFPSVLIGMFSVGVLLRVCWDWFLRQTHNPYAMLLYSLVLPFVIILFRGTIPDTIGRLFYTVGPIILFQFLARERIVKPYRRHLRVRTNSYV